MKPNDKARQLKAKNTALEVEVETLREKVEDTEAKMSLILAKVDHQHTHNVTVSDLPTPETFEKYPEEVKKVLIERLRTDISNDTSMVELEKGEQENRRKKIDDEYKLKNKGQNFALLSLVLLLSFALAFSLNGDSGVAIALVTVVILGAISAFLGFNPMRKNRNNESEDNGNDADDSTPVVS